MKKVLFSIGIFALPFVAGAQINTNIRNVNGLLQTVNDAIAAIVPVLVALAVVYFMYGALKYIMTDDEEAKGKAKNTMIYGGIAIFVMVSIWGIVNFLRNSTGLDNTRVQLPELPIRR